MDKPEQIQRFSSAFPVVVFTRPNITPAPEWQEYDQGPGIFDIPANQEVMLRIKNIDDQELRVLVRELLEFSPLVYLNLSENRKITNLGLEYVRTLEQLKMLNLSSCSLTDPGIVHLAGMHALEWLDLSYCNRLTDAGLKFLRNLSHLQYLNIKGCLRITKAGVARFGRRSLTIIH